MALDFLSGKTFNALAGIGNPSRFFQTLKDLHYEFIPHIFPDHYLFKSKTATYTRLHENFKVSITKPVVIKIRTYS